MSTTKTFWNWLARVCEVDQGKAPPMAMCQLHAKSADQYFAAVNLHPAGTQFICPTCKNRFRT